MKKGLKIIISKILIIGIILGSDGYMQNKEL